MIKNPRDEILPGLYSDQVFIASQGFKMKSYLHTAVVSGGVMSDDQEGELPFSLH